jgi:ABC-type ATPase involved in cell division
MQASTPESALIVFRQAGLRRGERWLLRPLDLAVGRGECVRLDGPPDAASTALRIMAALDEPSSGSVKIAGAELGQMPRRARLLIRRSLGIVLPEPLLLERASLRDNVAVAALVGGATRSEALARADTALARVGLKDVHGARAARAATAGQRQLAALARALVNRPALLLLDAPRRGLDAAQAAAILQLVADCAAGGVAVVAADDGAAAWPAFTRIVAVGGDGP